jgi:membrane protein DedA with SNARE-associated domain
MHWYEIIEIGLLASIKFLLAPFLAEAQEIDFIPSLIVTTTGGITGIFVFVYLGNYLKHIYRGIVYSIQRIFKSPEQIREAKLIPAKKFTWQNKLIIKIKRRFGLLGIATITPCIISIPLGCLVAAHFFADKKKVLLYNIISLIIWSVLLNSLAHIFSLSHLLGIHHRD